MRCQEQSVWLHAQDGTGPGNTALAFHNKQLLALVETDLPYIVSFFVCFLIVWPALYLASRSTARNAAGTLDQQISCGMRTATLPEGRRCRLGLLLNWQEALNSVNGSLSAHVRFKTFRLCGSLFRLVHDRPLCRCESMMTHMLRHWSARRMAATLRQGLQLTQRLIQRQVRPSSNLRSK